MDAAAVVWVIALLYIFVDVNYFLRTVFTLLVGCVFHKRVRINETTKVYGMCLPSDVDMMVCHMNNARYLRELDFARYHFYERAGLFRRMFAARTVTLQTASWIRYRQSIALFAVYTIHTKAIFWDDRSIFLEHQFRTLDGCLRCVGMSRQTVLSGSMQDYVEGAQPPQPSAELSHWLASIHASSQRLQATNGNGSSSQDIDACDRKTDVCNNR
ncbi:hypothetical protein LSTR_LSTR000906 [Laodelphax striatellus]|uniref:Protein THEM6 n=1 Tax=Laodelphax striatellus TaxID=195883 RepID=A0A482X0N5_LAOST|nr:hypothetical protein LSTR_LSTR000906 [Laodelphax striatellus]